MGKKQGAGFCFAEGKSMRLKLNQGKILYTLCLLVGYLNNLSMLSYFDLVKAMLMLFFKTVCQVREIDNVKLLRVM